MRLTVCLSLLFIGTLIPTNTVKGISPLSPFASLSPPDTLEQAKELRDNGKLKTAMKLLESYHEAHPTDLNSSWLFAQTAYWAKRYKLAKKIYELTIWYHPGNLYLQVDYANMLVALGKLREALPYLENFLIYYPGNAQVERTLARIKYYKGKYKEAYSEVSELKEREPADPEMTSLLDEIRQAKAPRIGITGSYYTDNQPLQTISPLLAADIWLHPLSTLRFNIRAPLFTQGGAWTNALWLQAGNSSFIWYGNWKVTIDAGILRYPYKNTTTWTGNFELEKQSYRNLVTIFQAERKPYFATGSSIDTVINEYHVAETIRWDNFDSWNGQISYNWDYFLTDYNSIYSFAGWGFAPTLKASVFDFRLGYGISYSTSTDDNFQAAGKNADIIPNYDPAVGIEGIYYPYFTPNHQFINSALLTVGIHPVEGFDIGISGNLGFFARARIPFLYLDTNGAGGFVIKKDFINDRYFPYTISAFVSWQVSKKVNLRADYNFNSTYFYAQHYAGLLLKIHLWNAKKEK